MASLEPPHALGNHCSIIYNNTLYVYSPDAFQSLPLESGAEWSQESMGVSVTGATCNQGWVEGDSSRPALFVVGGSTNSSSIQYPGLQLYSFVDKSWANLTPVVTVTENRLHHGSAFLNASSSLLVYAGSQDGNDGLSTQTFLISTVAPYNVLSFESAAPPVTDPIVLPWNDTSAMMVGGSTSNMDVFVFSPDAAWQDAGVDLASAIPSSTEAQCSLLTLSDQSKILETFDMSTSPNTVTRTVLLTSGGTPASTGQTIGAAASSSTDSRKRDFTLSDFPSYNSTLAPTATRNGFSLTQDENGLVVISGGGTASDPLCIFNSTGNGWLNTTQFLEKTQSTITIGGSGSSATASSTVSPAATSSAASSGKSSSGNNTNRALVILGGVLGAIFGVAALCIIALLVLRWLRKKKEAQHKSKTSDFPQDPKVRRRSTSFSFHEQDNQPFSKAGMPMARDPVINTDSAAFFKEIGQDPIPAPRRQNSALAQPKMPISRPIPLQVRSEESVKKSMGSSGIADASSGEIDPSLHGPAKRKTDEGWSDYFVGNNAFDLTDGRSTYASQSDYRGSKQSTWPDYSARDSRLQSGLGTQVRQGNVAMGSPSVEHPSANGRGTGLAVSEGINGKISSGHSLTSSVADEDDHEPLQEPVDYDRIGDAYSSGVPASIPDDSQWSAMGGYRNGNRPPSSNYTQSYYPPQSTYGGPRDTTLSAFPIPDQNRVTRWPAEETEPQPALPAPITNTRAPPSRPARPSHASEQMRDVFAVHGRTHTPSDMSWLNLGNNDNR